MAEPAIKENLAKNELNTIVRSTDVMTGGNNRHRMLYFQLKRSIKNAQSIDMIVSFLMESGVRMILDDLRLAVDRGIKIRLLTGNYLGITQPSALYLIKKEFGNKIDLRFYNEKERSFHPKSYFFHYENFSEIYIGSSNISRSALTSGIEWNYKFSTNEDPDNFKEFYDTFVDLFTKHSIEIDDAELSRYAKNWHRPAVLKDLERYDDEEEEEVNVVPIFQPRGVQIEALCALDGCRQEGIKKALVQAATGIGKTYIAAFDSVPYNRILFVAHREEILKQAANAFINVRGVNNCGFFTGKEKENNRPLIFASVATLGRAEYLNEAYFPVNYFDYIIIDEVHHAVNKQYMNIINYFTPKFLLGLTATPERLDNRDVYSIFDYNVPYEISLQDGINRGVLVPFHYYGIYDEIDYSAMQYVSGRYLEADLNEAYIGNEQRNNLIYKHYRKYRSIRSLGFCCSRKHAEAMARDFSRRGIKSVAVYSNSDGEFSEERDIAINKLRKAEINIIFSVDMFNEGVDIPEVDMVMFLRPTESPVVFLQQLGRGLRKAKNKEYLTVIDFIGNYKKIEKIPQWLSGNKISERKAAYSGDLDYPDYCIVDFDTKVIDLFEHIEKRNRNIKTIVQEEYYRVKEHLQHRPSRVELFLQMDHDIFCLCKSKQHNPFNDYMKFLDDMNELDQDEKQLYGCIAGDFLNHVETTNMTRIYKMPILAAFCGDENFRMELTDDDLLSVWKNFFKVNNNWRDLPNVANLDEYNRISDKMHMNNIKKNPVKYLISSGKGFFVTSGRSTIAVRKELAPYTKDKIFMNHYRDIISYRTMEYYKKKYDSTSTK